MQTLCDAAACASAVTMPLAPRRSAAWSGSSARRFGECGAGGGSPQGLRRGFAALCARAGQLQQPVADRLAEDYLSRTLVMGGEERRGISRNDQPPRWRARFPGAAAVRPFPAPAHSPQLANPAAWAGPPSASISSAVGASSQASPTHTATGQPQRAPPPPPQPATPSTPAAA
jgi:hypothetical protein